MNKPMPYFDMVAQWRITNGGEPYQEWLWSIGEGDTYREVGLNFSGDGTRGQVTVYDHHLGVRRHRTHARYVERMTTLLIALYTQEATTL